MTTQGPAHLRSTRLDFVRFRIGDDEVTVGFLAALDLAERCSRAVTEAGRDDIAREVARKIRGAGASRPIVLSPEHLAALARVIDAWERDAATVLQLRERI